MPVRAVRYSRFGELPEVVEVPDPTPPPGGAVIAVEATGLCRSDWHGWRGHDPVIGLPHVPGHEFAGRVAAVGAGVTRWQVGERVTAAFVGACGTCPACLAGQQQVCHGQQQPGFDYWGSFAEYVVVQHADTNLVRLPDEVDFRAAAALGCRFATAFRAVVAQGRVRPGEWVAVYGCGGVGLAAVMIAAAAGARVLAVDVQPAALALARRHGATLTLSPTDQPGPDPAGPAAAGSDQTGSDQTGSGTADAVRAATDGGTHLSIDALGSQDILTTAIRGLRRQGRHVQVGLFAPGGGPPTVPIDLVMGRELQILGSHGMAAHAYPPMLSLIVSGVLRPADLVTDVLALDAAPAALAALDGLAPPGIRVITPGLR